jgi:hypothetical protein
VSAVQFVLSELSTTINGPIGVFGLGTNGIWRRWFTELFDKTPAIHRVISGGDDGPGIGALKAGYLVGIKTAGFTLPGYRRVNHTGAKIVDDTLRRLSLTDIVSADLDRDRHNITALAESDPVSPTDYTWDTRDTLDVLAITTDADVIAEIADNNDLTIDTVVKFYRKWGGVNGNLEIAVGNYRGRHPPVLMISVGDDDDTGYSLARSFFSQMPLGVPVQHDLWEKYTEIDGNIVFRTDGVKLSINFETRPPPSKIAEIINRFDRPGELVVFGNDTGTAVWKRWFVELLTKAKLVTSVSSGGDDGPALGVLAAARDIGIDTGGFVVRGGRLRGPDGILTEDLKTVVMYKLVIDHRTTTVDVRDARNMGPGRPDNRGYQPAYLEYDEDNLPPPPSYRPPGYTPPGYVDVVDEYRIQN